MRNLFRGYYKPSAEELSDIWKNCIFSFDTNVLLHIYCYTPETRARFFEILNHLKERIWIPHQVGYEYQKNRIYVIERYVKAYDRIERNLKEKLQDITNDFHEYKRHPFINTQDILEDIEQVIEKVISKIRVAQENHPNYLEYDELREQLSDLFEGKVGHPYTEEELENIYYQKAEKRFQYHKPPGYKDANKALPKNYGDVILWFQLIDYAKVQQRPLIFVTDDNKEDWWLKYNGETLEPRPDLIQEIISEVGGDKFQFYMYHSDQFLDYAEKFFELPVQPEVVQEVREIVLHKIVNQRIVVDSEYLRSVGYDELNQVLEVEFQKGEIYQYKHVPPTVYAGLMSAPSHGKYFNANIKDVYLYYKLN